jgi:hypothetical protein
VNSFWTDSRIKLDSSQIQLFQSELSHIEQEKLSSTAWSQMFLNSRENKFLFDILRPRDDETFIDWRRRYPDLLKEAFHRSPKSLELAASEWKSFTYQFLKDRDNPPFIEIQEGLGIYGRSPFLRRLKRFSQRRLNMMWDAISEPWRKVCRKGEIIDLKRYRAYV